MSKKLDKKIDVEQILEEVDKTEEIKKETSDAPFNEVIEEHRAALLAQYKKSRKISNIIMAITVLLVIGCFILISQKEVVCQIIGYVVAGLVIVGMLVYYFLTKNKFPTATKEYIKLVTSTLNGFNYRATEYTDVTSDPDEKLELAEIIADDIYKGINDISSRNLVRGAYLNHSFLVADAAIYSGSGKGKKTDFVGKYISIQNDLEFNGKIVLINKLAENSVDLPTNLEGLELVLEEGNFSIYASSDLKDKAESVLGKSFINTIQNLEIKDILLNINVVVWAGHTALYLSYADSIIALPFEKPFDGEPMEVFEKQQRQLFQALVGLFK